MTNNFAVKIMLLDDEPFMLKLIGRQLKTSALRRCRPTPAAPLHSMRSPVHPARRS